MRKSTSILPGDKRSKGFTIVELLIVIVVISVLAAITIVAYNGIQQRARDSQRKSDLSQIAKALQLYKIDHNEEYPSPANGCDANPSGFFNQVYTNLSYTMSIASCLAADGKLSTELADPSGINAHRYMFRACLDGSGYIMANLESSLDNETATDGVCSSSTWDTLYGIDYVVRVN